GEPSLDVGHHALVDVLLEEFLEAVLVVGLEGGEGYLDPIVSPPTTAPLLFLVVAVLVVMVEGRANFGAPYIRIRKSVAQVAQVILLILILIILIFLIREFY